MFTQNDSAYAAALDLQAAGVAVQVAGGECKSYLDSHGIALRAFDGTDSKFAEHFKLFAEDELRGLVFNRLRLQFAEVGAYRPDPAIKLCLACGRIASDADRAGLRDHFAGKGWDLWDESCLRERLNQMSDQGYENQVSAVVAKLLLRGKVE